MRFINLSLDLILVPPSVGLIIGYHAVLWCILKKQPLRTSIGFTATKRRKWALALTENGSLLGVQSLRNSLMTAILASTIALMINSALAAMMNNIYNAKKLLPGSLFGSQTGSIIVLKYSLASLFLVGSFFCSSMAIGFLTEANFLINVPDGVPARNAHTMLELGSNLANMGNRVLYAALPMLLWMFGPVPMAVSSVLIVYFLYDRDFNTAGKNQSQ